jgi:hypothetical protein
MKKKRLFYDIETSLCEGVFFRPGYNQRVTPQQVLKHAQIICISWSWEGEDEVHNIDWGLKEQDDKKLLKKFIKELNKADEIVAHNGDRFDIRWIRARALKHDLKDMKPHYRTIDTYKIAKKYLALPGYRLRDIAEYYGLEAKLDPGGLQTWIDVVIHKDKEALDTMNWYCDGDIVTLKEVYYKMQPFILHQFNYAVKNGGEKFHCPECGKLGCWNKTYTTAAGTIQHYMRCRDKQGCNKMYKINNKTYQDYLRYCMLNGIRLHKRHK